MTSIVILISNCKVSQKYDQQLIRRCQELIWQLMISYLLSYYPLYAISTKCVLLLHGREFCSFLYQPVSYIFQGPPLYSRRASWSGKSNSDHHDGAAHWQITISITFDSPCVQQSRFFEKKNRLLITPHIMKSAKKSSEHWKLRAPSNLQAWMRKYSQDAQEEKK